MSIKTPSIVLGSILSLVVLSAAGCADNSSPQNVPTPSQATLATGGAHSIYAINYPTSGSETVLSYAINGSASSTLTLPATFDAGSIAIDRNSGVEYIGGQDLNAGPEVLVYAAGATGSATPVRTILPTTAAEFAYADSIAVDNVGQLYILSTSGVAVYPSTANGSVAPTRWITGSSTGIVQDVSIAVDTAGNIYVASADANGVTGSIGVFTSSANGNAAPSRTITYPNGIIFGVAVDSNLNIYASEETFISSNSVTNAKIVQYAAGASGNATPVRTISGGATGISYLGAVATDTS